MPYVVLQSPSPQSVLETADARWEAILATRADFGPAVELQRRLVAIVLDASAALARAPIPRLSMPPKYVAAKLTRGVPVFTGEPIPVPVGPLRGPLLTLCEALAAGGAGDTATHIKTAIEQGKLDAADLMTASLTRNQEAIRSGAVALGLAADLLWLVAELSISPFANALQRMLFSSGEPALSAALGAWNSGYCPACGSWPALAEVTSSRRMLRCSFCATGWELNQYSCVYCGEQGDNFVTAAPDVERKDRRLELCQKCGAYLKTVDVPEYSPFPLLAISDLETMDLDLAAMEHGYNRPPMKDFAARR